MSSTTRLTWVAATLFLFVFPLTIHKPGMPGTIKADEGAYYLMARSLAEDGDLLCEAKDVARLGAEFPYLPAENVILMTDDGWQTAHFGKPYFYSLLAAPFAFLFHANGMVAFNMLLLMGMVGLGALYLARWNPDGVALLFSAGFFLLSNTWAYVFWMHTEIFNMFAATACLYLAFVPPPDALGAARGWRRVWARLRRADARAWLSGAAIVLAAYNKPQLAALGLPAWWLFARRDGWRGAARWAAGGAVAMLLLCAGSIALTGHASAYLGGERAGFKISDFTKVPFTPAEPVAPSGNAADGPAVAPATERPQNTWWWIFRTPPLEQRTLTNFGLFFVGRHTGLFLYAPFVLVALLLFLVHGRRSTERWLVLLSAALVALSFLLWIPFNWHGGGGFVGNRYFVNALPVFLFLVTRIQPVWSVVAAWALGGLLIGDIFFTPYGAMVPQPTLQSHTRNEPFTRFPLELTLGRQVPGYRGAGSDGVWFTGRRDQFLPHLDGMWIHGGQPVEIWARSRKPLSRPVFRVESPRTPNRVTLRMGDSVRELRFDSTEPGANATRVTLEPTPPTPREVDANGEPVEMYYYRMVVESAEMRIRPWEEAPNRDEPSGFLVGVILTYLGTEADLAVDIFRADWAEAPVPETMPAGSTLSVPVRVVNVSDSNWPSGGPTRVSLSYHWLDAEGRLVIGDGARSALPRDLPAGRAAQVELEIQTPAEAGNYQLRLNPVREQVAWFSDRHPESAPTFPVHIVPRGE